MLQEFKLYVVKRGRNIEKNFSYIFFKNKKDRIFKLEGMWFSVVKDNQNGQSGLKLCKGYKCGMDKFEYDLINGGKLLLFF